MKLWPLNSLYFCIFLAVGFAATAPFVLGIVGDFWWVALPAIGAWTVVLWIWGVRFIASSPEEAKAASIADRATATLIMLGQSVVGVILAVFLVGFLIRQWFALVLSLLIMAVVIFWCSREAPKRVEVEAPVHPPRHVSAPHEMVASPPPGPATPLGWLSHHVSLLVFLAFGALTVADCLHRHTVALGWPAIGMTLAYAAFCWIHLAAPRKPGEQAASFFEKLVGTFVALVGTVVGVVVLVLVVEAVGEFWVWILPAVAIVGGIVALLWPKPLKAAAARHRNKPRTAAGLD